MPVNFTGSVEPQGVDVSLTRTFTTQEAALWGQAGQNLQQAAKVAGDIRDDRYISSAAEELGNAVDQAATFLDQEHALTQAIARGDKNSYDELAQRLTVLKRGNQQGMLNNTEFALRTNALVKDYTVRMPHLAAQFRALGNDAQGNYRAIAQEFSQDPIDQGVNEVLKEAASSGRSVSEVIYQRQVDQDVKNTNASLEMKSKVGALSKDDLVIGVQNVAMLSTAGAIVEINQQAKALFERGNVNESELDNLVNQYKTKLTSELYGQTYSLQQSALAAGVRMPPLSVDEQKAITNVVEAQLNNLASLLKGGGTKEEQLKRLEQANKLAKEGYLQKLLNSDGPFGELARQFGGDPIQLAAAQGAMLDAATDLQRLRQSGASQELITAAKDAALLGYRSAKSPTSGIQAYAVQQVYDGVWDNYLLNTYHIKLSGQSTAEQDSHVTPAAKGARDALSYSQYTKKPQDERAATALPYALTMTYDELMDGKQLLVNDLRANPSAAQTWLSDKASQAAVPLLSDPRGKGAIEVDVTRSTNPFQYVNVINPDDPGSAKLLKLNKMFVQIRDAFGPDAVEQWVDSLTELGVNRVQGAYGLKDSNRTTSKKKVAPRPTNVPSDYKETISKAEQAYGIPAGLLASLVAAESNWRPEAVSPKGAAGLFQIMPNEHPGVNPFDVNEASMYAASYLRQLYDKFGAWDKALAAYNWGPNRPGWEQVLQAGENWLDSPSLPKATRDYVRKILG